MLTKRDFRSLMLYEFKKGTNAAQTTRRIQEAFGEDSINRSTVQRWFNKFKAGDMDLENDERGRPQSTVDNNKLREVVEAKPETTVRELSEKLGKSKKNNKWVPNELDEYQKTRRYEICSTLIIRNNNDPFLDRLIICDERWILYDYRKRSAHWMDSNETQKPKLHQNKIMVILWWSASGTIHYNFMSPGEVITVERYCQELETMNKKLQHFTPTLFYRRGPILLHDNTKPHVTLTTLQKLNHMGYETLSYPVYSPDLSTTDNHFFKHLDEFFQQTVFNNQIAVESAFKEFVDSRTPEFYVNGINKLVACWQKCVESNGGYFEL
uniref:HTH_48 domain-containing protein n=1 Tax=Strongyloides stercoralis TaxID=6248 RepID=A0AAF5CZQ8_STRER